MKETVNVNIGSVAFVIDEDACAALRSYLDDIRSRLPEDDTETMGDLECRVAELLRERVASPMRVISLENVRAVMARIGAPADFGQRRDGAEARTAAPDEAQPTPRKLTRSRTDRSIAGICGGIGLFFGADSTLIRLITLLLILVGGLSIWAYVILWIVIPEQAEPAFNSYNKSR